MNIFYMYESAGIITILAFGESRFDTFSDLHALQRMCESKKLFSGIHFS